MKEEAVGRVFQAAGTAKQKQASDVLTLAHVSMEPLPSAGLQNAFKDSTCMNPFNLLNNCMRLVVFSVSCYTGGNRSTKRLGTCPRSHSQSPTTVI